MPDARVTAWLSSWDTVQKLYKLIEDPHIRQDDCLQILNQGAATMCELSRADENVGIGAGTELERRRVEKQRTKEFYDQALKEKL